MEPASTIPPERDFRNPIRLMMDCHRRIERFLDSVDAILGGGRDQALSTEQFSALDTALRYFAAAGPLHNADEEESFFPRLQQAGLLDACTQEALEVLTSDHRAGEKAHAALDDLGRRWIASGTLPADDLAQFTRLFQSLKTLYSRHIALEDRVVFVLGASLPEENLLAAGREMAVRRGLDTDNLPAASRCAERRQARERK